MCHDLCFLQSRNPCAYVAAHNQAEYRQAYQNHDLLLQIFNDGREHFFLFFKLWKKKKSFFEKKVFGIKLSFEFYSVLCVLVEFCVKGKVTRVKTEK